MANEAWYVGKGGQQLGPFSTDDLRAKLATGELTAADPVWRDGMAGWAAIGTVPELRPAPTAPAPRPQAPAPPPPAYAPAPAPAPAPAYAAPAPAYAAPAPPPPAPVADTSAWYIGRSGQQLGPFGTAQIQSMAASGQVGPGDVLWKEGMANWLPLASIPEFAAYGRPGGAPGMPGMQPYPGYPAGPSPVGLFFSNFFKDTAGVMANPDAGLEEAANRKSIAFPLVWICLKVLFAGLLALQGMPQMSRATAMAIASGREGPSLEAMERAMAASGREGPSLEAIGRAMGGGDNAFVTFLKTMLMDAIQVAIVFGALMLVMAGILRTPQPLPKALAVIGLSYIPVVAILAVAFVLGWLHPWFRGLEGAIEPARYILFYLLFQHTTQQPRRVAVLCVVAILFGCALIGGAIPRF